MGVLVEHGEMEKNVDLKEKVIARMLQLNPCFRVDVKIVLQDHYKMTL